MMAAKTAHHLAMMATFACVLAVVGCGKQQDSTKSDEAQAKQTPPEPKQPIKKETDTPTSKTPSNPASAKSDGTYTVKEYSQAGTTDFFYMWSKHAGKVVEVTGVVVDFASGPDGGVVNLGEKDAEFSTGGFDLADKQPWLKAMPGQTATVRTTVPMDKDAFKIKWEISSVKGSPPRSGSAEELVKELNGTNVNEFREKHGGTRAIIATGTITEVMLLEDGGAVVKLAAGKDETLQCSFAITKFEPVQLPESQRKKLAVGQKIKVLGNFNKLVSVELVSCVLLEPAP